MRQGLNRAIILIHQNVSLWKNSFYFVTSGTMIGEQPGNAATIGFFVALCCLRFIKLINDMTQLDTKPCLHGAF